MKTPHPNPFGIAFNALLAIDGKNNARAAAGLIFAMADVLHVCSDDSYADIATMLRNAADKLDTIDADDDGEGHALRAMN